MKISDNIKVLSIGIDNYQSEEIKNLGGCVQDAKKLKSFFLHQIGVPLENYKTLFNQQASRKGIITTFRKHFNNLVAGDTAVFHFSGHGSWEDASQEFIDAQLETYGSRNEVLVCHDSKTNNVLNIADKELRYLLAEAQRDATGKHIDDIHFLFILDCCHSGSMLRTDNSFAFRVRMHPGQSRRRSVAEYLEGQYASLLPLHIPAANFIALTACSPREAALENDEGGIFTNALITTLEYYYAQGRYPSYPELYATLRELVVQQSHTAQHPYFEYAGNVNPYDGFLKLQDKAHLPYPALLLQNHEWKVNLGAIHGIVYNDIKELNLKIFQRQNESLPIGSCRVRHVELEHTVVDIIDTEAAYEHLFSTSPLSTSRLQPIDAGLSVNLIGTQLAIQLQHDSPSPLPLYDKIRDGFHFIESSSATYQLAYIADTLLLRGAAQIRLLSITGYHSEVDSSFLHLLLQINQYERIKQLRNPSGSSIDPNKISLTFTYQNYAGQSVTRLSSSVAQDHIPITVSFIAHRGPLTYTISVQHENSAPLYFYLLHLDRKFSIKQKNENYLKRTLRRDQLYLYQSQQKKVGLGIGDSETQEIEDTFIVIAAANKLSIPYAFEQPGFASLYGQTMPAATFLHTHPTNTREDLQLPVWNESNWAVRKILVKTIRTTD